MSDTTMGPRLSDAQFFGERIDCTLPGLEEIPAAAAKGDYKTCRHLFAEHIRASLDTERYFKIKYEKPEDGHLIRYKGETDLDVCRRASRHELIVCGVPCRFGEKVDYFANPTYNGYKEWTWCLGRHPEWKILAHQYRQDHNEQWARTVAELFDMWVRQALAPDDDVEGSQTLCWRTIECGLRMGTSWPYALFTFYRSPYFTDDILTDWYKSLWEHGHRLHKNHRTGNWLVMEMNGLGQIGILYPELKDAGMWLDYATRKLLEELKKQVYPDGFQYELSSNYHYVVINNYLRLMRVAKAFDVPMPAEFSACLEKMLDVYVRLMRPSGNMPNINDGSDNMVSQPLGEQLDLFPDNETFRWVVNGCEGEAGRPAYTSAALPYAGMAILRSGWGKEDTWGFLDAGPFGKAHQHEDKLNFLLHAHGKYILTECGICAYDESDMRRHSLLSQAHNTVLVDGFGQNRLHGYRWNDEDITKESGMQWHFSPACDWASAVYDEGYGEGDVCDRDASHERRVFFMKQLKGLEPFFIVADRMTAKENEHTYEVLWHLDCKKFTADGMNVQADFLHMLVPAVPMDEGGLTVACGQSIPQLQGWKCRTFVQKDYYPVYAAQYRLRGKDRRWVTVLYPGESCPLAGVEASPDCKDTAITLRLQNGETIALDEAALMGKV